MFAGRNACRAATLARSHTSPCVSATPQLVQRDYSIYEDYTTTSSNYDSTRVAVGTDLILAGLAAARGGAVPVSEMDLLDGGCGAGLRRWRGGSRGF